ncbi:LrgB family protein [Geomonas sp. Red32]|uniref:LrgB family protein n=1 Tax=Geomonas sp. Red32 TaxID=2912856 RepID=UPI00202CEFC5|nr:LrgB family protein [Geomonas sp. Red32]MCM0081831.1 LrgB family protein [Geomonas sp. Red32]
MRSDILVNAVFWSLLTVGLYALGKALYHRKPTWWTSPLLLAPVLLIAAAVACHQSYREYIRGTHWLVVLLAPVTVAFAVPIYEQRLLIRKHWLLLVAGAAAGSATAMFSSWALATVFGLDGGLRLSLLPRSLSTPFAMTVSGDIGGVPTLTAVFVVITGVFGAVIGELLLGVLPFRSALARGALLGMGAHGAGTAKAHQIDGEVGAVAGLVMVMVGVMNVLAAPSVAKLLQWVG